MSGWGRRGSSEEPVEIELTPVDARRRPSPRHAPTATTPMGAASDRTALASVAPTNSRPTPPDRSVVVVSRRMLFATAGAVGVVALAIGWLTGHDGSGPASGSASPTTVMVATTARITDTIAPPPDAIRPGPTTTTTLAAGTPVDILLDPEIRSLPYELAVSTYDGELHRIDLSTGTVRSYDSSTNSDNRVAFTPANDLLVHGPRNLFALETITIDGELRQVATSDLYEWRTTQVVVDGRGDVWLVTAADTAVRMPLAEQSDRYDRPSPDEEATEVMQLPEGVVEQFGAFGDPAGGLLMYTSGDVFAVDPGGATRVTTGEIVAIGADTAIVNECDINASCGYFIVDRATGARRPYPLEEIVQQATPPLAQVNSEARVAIQRGSFWSAAATVAGNTAVFGIETADGTTSFRDGLVIIDIAEARVAGVLANTLGPVAIGDDGSWVFSASSAGGLVAFEVATGTTRRFGPSTNLGFNSIAIRNL